MLLLPVLRDLSLYPLRAYIRLTRHKAKQRRTHSIELHTASKSSAAAADDAVAEGAGSDSSVVNEVITDDSVANRAVRDKSVVEEAAAVDTDRADESPNDTSKHVNTDIGVAKSTTLLYDIRIQIMRADVTAHSRPAIATCSDTCATSTSNFTSTASSNPSPEAAVSTYHEHVRSPPATTATSVTATATAPSTVPNSSPTTLLGTVGSLPSALFSAVNHAAQSPVQWLAGAPASASSAASVLLAAPGRLLFDRGYGVQAAAPGRSSVTAATAATGADGGGGVVLAANTPYESVLIDQESFHMESPPTPEEIRSSQRKLSSDFSVFKPTKSPQFSNKGLDIAGTTGSVTSDDSVKENTNRADRIAARLEAMRKL